MHQICMGFCSGTPAIINRNHLAVMNIEEILIGIIAAGMVVWGAMYYLNLPVVHYSSMTGDCVKVLYSEQNCDNVQPRHIAVYVR